MFPARYELNFSINLLRKAVFKYGRESQGTRTRERLRWRGPAAYTKERPVLSSARRPTKTGP
jgi:hypothetical protein